MQENKKVVRHLPLLGEDALKTRIPKIGAFTHIEKKGGGARVRVLVSLKTYLYPRLSSVLIA
jgi:hypothetical protein